MGGDSERKIYQSPGSSLVFLLAIGNFWNSWKVPIVGHCIWWAILCWICNIGHKLHHQHFLSFLLFDSHCSPTFICLPPRKWAWVQLLKPNSSQIWLLVLFPPYKCAFSVNSESNQDIQSIICGIKRTLHTSGETDVISTLQIQTCNSHDPLFLPANFP